MIDLVPQPWKGFQLPKHVCQLLDRPRASISKLINYASQGIALVLVSEEIPVEL